MSYTPGPWYEMTKGDNEYQSQVCQESTGKTVALTYTSCDADATLIAAAPDLLEAIKCAAWELRGGRGVPINSKRIARDLEAAIAKAEGKEKL